MEEIEQLEESKFSKIVKIILAIFLIILITSFILTNSGLRQIVASLFESQTLTEDLSLELKDINVSFSEEAYNELSSVYFGNQSVEFKACLKGYIENNIYYINEIEKPKTYLQEFNRVVADICDKTTLISLHSHPFRKCIPSKHDIENFRELKKNNENVLLGIMCEGNRFSIYQ